MEDKNVLSDISLFITPSFPPHVSEQSRPIRLSESSFSYETPVCRPFSQTNPLSQRRPGLQDLAVH